SYFLVIFFDQLTCKPMCEHAKASVCVYRSLQELAYSFHYIVSVAGSQVVRFDCTFELDCGYVHLL
ncbi:hypothetical protein STEG23_026066, partial [Scotinomys teguina]